MSVYEVVALSFHPTTGRVPLRLLVETANEEEAVAEYVWSYIPEHELAIDAVRRVSAPVAEHFWSVTKGWKAAC